MRRVLFIKVVSLGCKLPSLQKCQHYEIYSYVDSSLCMAVDVQVVGVTSLAAKHQLIRKVSVVYAVYCRCLGHSRLHQLSEILSGIEDLDAVSSCSCYVITRRLTELATEDECAGFLPLRMMLPLALRSKQVSQ